MTEDITTTISEGFPGRIEESEIKPEKVGDEVKTMMADLSRNIRTYSVVDVSGRDQLPFVLYVNPESRFVALPHLIPPQISQLKVFPIHLMPLMTKQHPYKICISDIFRKNGDYCAIIIFEYTEFHTGCTRERKILLRGRESYVQFCLNELNETATQIAWNAELLSYEQMCSLYNIGDSTNKKAHQFTDCVELSDGDDDDERTEGMEELEPLVPNNELDLQQEIDAELEKQLYFASNMRDNQGNPIKIQMTLRSLMDLCQINYLNDSIMEFVMMHIIFPKAAIPVDFITSYEWCGLGKMAEKITDITTFRQFIQMSENDIEEFQSNRSVKKLFSLDKKYILCPIHDPISHHWSLAVITDLHHWLKSSRDELDTKNVPIVYFFDSMTHDPRNKFAVPNIQKRIFEKTMLPLFRIGAAIIHKNYSLFFRTSIRFRGVTEVPGQSNNVDCGAYVMLYAEAIVNGELKEIRNATDCFHWTWENAPPYDKERMVMDLADKRRDYYEVVRERVVGDISPVERVEKLLNSAEQLKLVAAISSKFNPRSIPDDTFSIEEGMDEVPDLDLETEEDEDEEEEMDTSGSGENY